MLNIEDPTIKVDDSTTSSSLSTNYQSYKFSIGKPLPTIVDDDSEIVSNNNNNNNRNTDNKTADETSSTISDIAFYSRQFLSPFTRPRSSTISGSPNSSPSRQISTQLQQYAQNLLAQGGLSHLPAELLLAIFQFFTPQEICVVGMTCKWWQIVSEQNSLWITKFQENFQRPLTTLEKFQNANESWKELYIQHYFMDSSYSEIERLLVLFPVTPEYEHDITILLNRVLTYLKHTECLSEYILKLEELKNIHIIFGNKIEAAICLLNHSQLISWNADATFNEEYGYPSESHSDRKERLLNNALELFVEGKYWERALIIIRKLRKKYNKDLSRQTDKQLLIKKMVLLSKSEHTCYQSIEGKDGRFFEEYFFVEFRGKGFPKSVDGKKFIFRGKELEKLGYFVGRLKNRYPGAEVVPKTEKNEFGTGQYIHIRPCKPISMPKHIVGSAAGASLSLTYNLNSQESAHMRRSNYKNEQSFINNNAKLFFYSMPFKKQSQQQQPRSDNEFLDLWTCHTYIVAKSTFPGLIRCTEVKSIIEIQKNPLETAIETLEKKNKQLESIFATTKQTKEWSNLLTMALDGVVDAAVSGGVNMYRVFFSLSYIQENSGHLQLLHSLKSILLQQRNLLETGLDIHAHYCPANMKALQTKMERCFEKWKQIISELVVHEINCEEPSLEIAKPPSPIKMLDAIDLPSVSASLSSSKLNIQHASTSTSTTTTTTSTTSVVLSPSKQILQPPTTSQLKHSSSLIAPRGWINGQKQQPIKRVIPTTAASSTTVRKPSTPSSLLALTPSKIPTKSMHKTPTNSSSSSSLLKKQQQLVNTPLNEVSNQSNNLSNKSPITLAHISPIVPIPPKPSTPTTPSITSTSIISKSTSSPSISSNSNSKSTTNNSSSNSNSSTVRTTTTTTSSSSSSSSLYRPTLSHLAKKESPPTNTPNITSPIMKSQTSSSKPQTSPHSKPSLGLTLTNIKRRLSSNSSSSSSSSASHAKTNIEEKKVVSSSKPPKFKETTTSTTSTSTSSSSLNNTTTSIALKARPPTPPRQHPLVQHQQQPTTQSNTTLSKPPLSPGAKRIVKSSSTTSSSSQFNYPSDIVDSPLIKHGYNKRVALTPLPLSLSLSTASASASIATPSSTNVSLKPRPPTPPKISISN
ncbi:DOCK family protein [Heterostelium album PN500]|uniref:DOCK family protein n=1 Tax=Heterostelium pallidum (strain ATCC 26659 / Pp 5 / PN500) TaxID=670386 RepID=D3BCZ1_HETP5|nr:DOCK family protein [Heterostelium album PN500]EFA80783.1 DOCK family protein [Heterostelium album PN500]|eukprot:XP_020432902.1 DOCK family protein [Heterostelium album PN500]